MELVYDKSFYEWVDIWQNNQGRKQVEVMEAFSCSESRSKFGLRTLPYLIEGVKSTNSNIALQAAIGIREIGEDAREAQEALLSRFEDKNDDVATRCIWAFRATKPSIKYTTIIIDKIENMVKRKLISTHPYSSSGHRRGELMGLFTTYGEEIIPILLNWKRRSPELRGLIDQFIERVKEGPL